MTDETIVAVFDEPAHAEAAKRDLLAAGIPAEAISHYAGSTTEARSASTVAPAQEQGFWSRLLGGEPDHHPSVFDRSVESGSTVLTVRTPAQHVESVGGILERHNPIDLDERAGAYGATQDAPAQDYRSTAAPVATRGEDAASLQLSEERLEVGKRLVNRGTTRVRRYVTEIPVEQQVRLHDETVGIERVPVTDGRPVSEAAFTDRTIEMTESSEEAVVGKTAHVYEEVALRRQEAERVETVRDTVRREDVEVTEAPDTLRTPKKI
ncbi:YsnF/AvaK domain-containing protein [Lichenicoccus roseus]|uniref:DUF2382 domain-containing protein n=1 Tax=Lichenicoccus roseus TaxID=2683649 RepID=A0A5R9J479_9PROT|nr:YsnF/AvaK domain-containing protein [Lichenicoccus roseus]TLU71673.1 DUF2382 domain-containing protein [Lichenicoccus roseus]